MIIKSNVVDSLFEVIKLYTRQPPIRPLWNQLSKNIHLLQLNVLIAIVLMCSFSASVHAKDTIQQLIIPKYDNAILKDGYERWNQNYTTQGFVIYASVLFENPTQQNYDSKRLRSNESGRHDRTSNHQPIRYNITMKGYSVYEDNDKAIKFWSFDKIELNMNKKPELFFGVQKPFY